MLTPTIKVWKTAYLSTNLTVCPRARGVRLLGQGVRFLGFFTWSVGGTFMWDGYALFSQNPAGGTFLSGRVRLYGSL